MTTYTLKRKTFAAPVFATQAAAKAAGYTSNAGNLLTRNFQNTKTLVNKNLLAQGEANLKNATTEAAKKAAQEQIDSATTTVALSNGERAWERTKGVAKLGGIAAVGGTIYAGSKINNAANGND